MFLTEHDLELNSENMLDVYRSDSQKSDSSQRPRVSFNRDVRIKKIGNSDAASIVEALAGDGEGHLVPTPVRREKIKASRRELALEADRVLKQADSVASLHSASPPRRQQRSKADGGSSSLQRKTSFGGTDSKKWNSEGKLSSYMSLDRPKNRIRKREPPTWEDQRSGGQQYRSSADLTAAAAPKRRSTAAAGGRLTRSVSDAGDRDKPLADGKDAKRSISLFGTIERIKTKIKKRPTAVADAVAGPRKTAAVERSAEPVASAQPPPPSPPPAPVRAKKQLSPIIELSPRDEYFKYSVDGPFDSYSRDKDDRRDDDDSVSSPPRPVRGQKVDRIVRQLQQEQEQRQRQQRRHRQVLSTAAELVRPPSSPPPPPPPQPDFAHAHNGNEPFSYTAASPPTVVHLPDAQAAAAAAEDRSPPPPQRRQYRSAAGMNDTWTSSSYDDLSLRRDALESRLQKRAAVTRPLRATAASSPGPSTVRVVRAASSATPPSAADTYATVYKKNETLGGGDRYFERKIVTEHRFARRTPRLSGDGEDDATTALADGGYDYDDDNDDGDDDRDRDHDRDRHDGRRHWRDRSLPDSGRRRPPQATTTRAASSGMPTIVSRNNVAVVNGQKPAKKRSRLDKFKMLFTGGSAAKENKRPSPTKAQYNSSDPESYTSSLRKRYNVFTGNDNNKAGNHAASGNRRMSSPSKTSKTTGNNTWFKSLDRFGKKNANKRSKTFTSGSENDDEIRVHRVSDRNTGRGTTTRSYHSVGNLNSLDMDQSPRLIADKRHSLIDSSAGSTTEGDSSQKSHKSTVYLHATTVGEIPESRQLHQSVFGAKSRRAASREELSSRNDAFGAQKRTLSRSVSVLAPWAPRHAEGRTVDYDERGRPPRAPSAGHRRPSPARNVPAAKGPSRGGDPEERSPSARKTRASSGEESSLLDEVIIRTTGRTGKLIKDDRATSRQIGRSMSSVNRAGGGGVTVTRVRTKT